MGTVVESPVQLSEVIPLAFVGVTNEGVIVPPPGESPMVAFRMGNPGPISPSAGSMFSVTSRALTGTVEPLGARLGTVATATTEALSVERCPPRVV